MYLVKKFFEYFFPKLREDDYKKAVYDLNKEETKIFDSMRPYDKKHSVEVYKMLITDEILKDNILYRKLALLHDCGKDNTDIFVRVFHKTGFRTKLRNHPENGYKKLKNINLELAELIKNHHNREYTEEMKQFQILDDKE